MARDTVAAMRVAAVQMTATSDKDRNLQVADGLVGRAAQEGARLVVLPELFNLLGPADAMRAGAEPLDGPTLTWARQRAAELEVALLAGSFTEAIPDSELTHNTSCLVDPGGELVATYRKIHLFDNEVPGAAYHESATVAPGDEVVTAPVTGPEGDALTVGLSTCYDLRFPELYRILALRGADIVVLPSAFTFTTGADHWEPLLRTRAIENQVFVVAPDQCGRTGAGITCWGHSMIVDPWGTPLASAPAAGEQVVIADLDLGGRAEIRRRLPSLANRRPTAYRWPEADPAG